MSRYIDAELIENRRWIISPNVERITGKGLIGMLADIVFPDEIDDIPTADVAPIVHGHWIEAENGVCQCSVCKNDPWWKDNCVNPFKNWNYCPNCGAKMNGGNTN